MTPESLDPFSYLFRSSALKIRERRTLMYTYVVARKVAIMFKTSVSLFEVSSNPGVSMRDTVLPSRVNLSANWTSAVHDSKSPPICRRSEPVVRLMNWRQPGQFLVIISGCTLLTDVFPLPVAPMTLWRRFRQCFDGIVGDQVRTLS